MARDVARNDLLAETGRRNHAVRWTTADHDNVADNLLDYQRAKPCSMADPVMGSMRQHLFAGVGVFKKPRNAVNLMNALERAEVVSRAPRRLINIEALDAALDKFRYGALFGKPLSAEKKARVRDTLLTFERLARQREGYLKDRAQHRTALADKLATQAALLEPYGHDPQWYRSRFLADGSVQSAQDAYVRCTELLHTYPSALPSSSKQRPCPAK